MKRNTTIVGAVMIQHEDEREHDRDGFYSFAHVRLHGARLSLVKGWRYSSIGAASVVGVDIIRRISHEYDLSPTEVINQLRMGAQFSITLVTAGMGATYHVSMETN